MSTYEPQCIHIGFGQIRLVVQCQIQQIFDILVSNVQIIPFENRSLCKPTNFLIEISLWTRLICNTKREVISWIIMDETLQNNFIRLYLFNFIFNQ